MTFNGPLVSFDHSFNFNVQRSTNIGLIFGGGNLNSLPEDDIEISKIKLNAFPPTA